MAIFGGGLVVVNKKKRSKKTGQAVGHFENTLHESIAEGLRNVLGDDGMHATLFNLQLIEYARNPGEFHKSLEIIYGKGAIILEKMIIKEMCRAFGIPYRETEPFGFANYCESAKNLLTRTV